MIERKQEEAVKNAVLLLYYCTMCASKHYDVCASKGFDVGGFCLHLAQCSSARNPANIFSRALAALCSPRRQNRPVAGVKETQPKKSLGGFFSFGGFLRTKPSL
jgi:anaerobic ribonucleoside-triphosphate reductase